MKRLPPIDVLRPGHAHENIVNVERIVSGLRWISDATVWFDACLACPAWREIAISGSKRAEATASLQVASVAISGIDAIVLDV